MDPEAVREFCLSLPHVEEEVKWGDDLTFMVGRKMFLVLVLEAGYSTCCSFKCTPEAAAELVERDGIVPAPYLARYHWVALERFDALEPDELRALMRTSYRLVFSKLPRKVQTRLQG